MGLQMKHSWSSRAVPPVLVAAVIGCVWYALESRPQSPLVAPTAAATPVRASPEASSTAHAEPQPSVSPNVTKQGSELHFSVDPAPYKHIQKVEFYVESHFVGTAYSQPYNVVVSENNLTAGTHTVTAKIYMPSGA